MLGDGRLIKRRIHDGKGWVQNFSFFPLGLVFVGNLFFLFVALKGLYDFSIFT